MLITNEDYELIQAVFEHCRDEICQEFNIDQKFIEKFNLTRYG